MQTRSCVYPCNASRDPRSLTMSINSKRNSLLNFGKATGYLPDGQPAFSHRHPSSRLRKESTQIARSMRSIMSRLGFVFTILMLGALLTGAYRPALAAQPLLTLRGYVPNEVSTSTRKGEVPSQQQMRLS